MTHRKVDGPWPKPKSIVSSHEEYQELYKSDDYIKVPDLKHRGVYKIFSRNLICGVYDSKRNGFLGIRLKFRSRFLFMEFHWDNEEFATAKPLELIEMLPDDFEIDDNSNELFDYLEKKEEEIENGNGTDS